MTRISDGFERPGAIVIEIDGRPLVTYPGETIAAAMQASGLPRMRDDRSGYARGMFCNMGTCSECLVWVNSGDDQPWLRRRACLLPASKPMRIVTSDPDS